jgi:hypothetical protein
VSAFLPDTIVLAQATITAHRKQTVTTSALLRDLNEEVSWTNVSAVANALRAAGWTPHPLPAIPGRDLKGDVRWDPPGPKPAPPQPLTVGDLHAKLTDLLHDGLGSAPVRAWGCDCVGEVMDIKVVRDDVDAGAPVVVDLLRREQMP